MKLHALRLRNFKGVRAFELRAEGRDVTIYGDNATGKTSVADALMWVLFGKNSENRKDFGIKTLEHGRAVSALEHEVEAVLDVGGGKLLTLRKVYEEVHTKKRGQATREFTGHTTSHFVDGVPVTAGEYAERVNALMDEGAFRLLTDPRYFNEVLKWQDRRRILLEVCGDVSDDDVIAAHEDLADLPAALAGRGIDDHRKVVVARRAKVNEELKTLPVRIDEVRRGLPSAPELSGKQLTQGLAGAKSQHQAALEALAEAKAGHVDLSGERRRLREVEDALTDWDRKARRQVDELQEKLAATARSAKVAVSEAQERIRRWEAEVPQRALEVKQLDERLEALRVEWREVHARSVEVHSEETCPACKQALPAEQVAAAHAAATEALHAKRARELARITADGETLKVRRSTAAAELEMLESRLTNQRTGLVTLEQELAAAEAATVPAVDATSKPAYTKLAAERDELTRRIEQLATGSASAALEGLAARVDEAAANVTAFEADLRTLEVRAAGQAREAELAEQEQTLAREYEDLERQLHLMDLFLRTKVSLLTERINARFTVVRFKLFEEQINEGLRETCEATIDGVPYADLNGGGKVRAGLDIINALADHHKFWPFIVLDNAESVTQLLATRGQQIRLVVSAKDKALRVELAREEVAA